MATAEITIDKDEIVRLMKGSILDVIAQIEADLAKGASSEWAISRARNGTRLMGEATDPSAATSELDPVAKAKLLVNDLNMLLYDLGAKGIETEVVAHTRATDCAKRIASVSLAIFQRL